MDIGRYVILNCQSRGYQVYTCHYFHGGYLPFLDNDVIFATHPLPRRRLNGNVKVINRII